ncbi:ring-hydroxylating oxygenase subunit alpha [Hyphomicrobium sp. CS1GBMeth3]|uniref:ring-hydroxylating oxygenase subunit alpha n=1 Tax=Hyphomicrobium sp. CS1GBMeth3 TaxID=1892845 RepID=UPI00092FDB3B|nr:ring-hydroxylating oxygenase subunit alpha [Hyphomicrobium sp. CS1GBMeth3]
MLHRPDLGFYDEGQDLSSIDFYAKALGSFGEARVLPPTAFRSLQFSLLEDEMIWTRDWTAVGCSDEIAEEGDLLPFTVGIHGIHVQRVGGAFKARFNKAQHGGCRAIPQQCQTGKKTKCSFTSCGYSRDRDAIPARDLGDDTPEMQQYLGLRPERLLTAHADTFGPLIFVNLDLQPVPNGVALAELNRAGRFFEGSAHRAAAGKLEFPANWKLLGQHLAAGETMSESDDGSWLLARSSVDGRSADVAWLFPNLVLIRAERVTCAIVLQHTAIGQTLCRYFVYGTAGETSSAFWSREIGRRAANAAADHHATVRWGTNFRPETKGAALPLQASPQGLWMQRLLARRAVQVSNGHFPQPIFQHAGG